MTIIYYIFSFLICIRCLIGIVSLILKVLFDWNVGLVGECGMIGKEVVNWGTSKDEEKDVGWWCRGGENISLGLKFWIDVTGVNGENVGKGWGAEEE